MPTAPEPKLDDLIQDCSLSSAQACFRKLCPSGFKRSSAELENPDGERFTGFTQFGELPLNGDTLLFVYAETQSDLSQRSARKAQFDAARELLKARGEYDAGIFIYRGANGAFRLSLISKIYKGTKADFSHFRRYTYFVDPRTDGNSTFIRQIGGCAFDSLEAIQEAFSVEAINKDFYRELSNWYFWAMRHVHFPTDDVALDKTDILADKQKVREHDAKNLIRLLTRMLFVWFIKQRDLVPHDLFDPEAIAHDYLDGFDQQSRETHFYKAILQNLFFATLNQTKDKREFRKMGAAHRDNGSLMRYKSAFKEPQRFVDRVESITPFLNGGLFECLDFLHPTEKGPQGGRKKVYEDGFSDHPSNPLKVPDFLFFGEATTEDLSGDYGDKKRKKEPVQGLLHILHRYNFTIVENTPIEQEVALDPELLGKVFENLLASYNPETQTTARKQTGSFYTPRTIVDYMVDESLKGYLLKPLTEDAGMTEDDAKVGLELLFSYEEKEMDTCFNPEEVQVVIRAIDRCKILDPACGSGAFPMGTLQKLVYILGKLDPDNEQWEAVQIDEARNIPDATERRERIREIGQDFLDNGDDYGRKLYLIENCLYGIDIQSIATQVSKLRFFISLVVDQQIRPDRPNFGVRPLPNLETKFVTADTLIAIEKPAQQGELAELTTLRELQDALQEVRHKIFSVKQTETKQKYKDEDLALREKIAAELKKNGWHSDTADRLAAWDPYKQNNSADFFDPEWMFGLKGFDVVIGNPPYISVEKFAGTEKQKQWKNNFSTYAARGDIYCFFYERGAQLLKDGGHLSYITSNKWMRAGYGEKLRGFLSNSVDTQFLLDFGMAQNFGAATTYTCITQFEKQESQAHLQTCYATDDREAMANPAEYMAANSVLQTDLTKLPWVVLSPQRFEIQKQVGAQGVPLKDWNIQINYGIKTGFNEAFYLNQQQHDDLIDEDPNSADLIVKLLRGRDVGRYQANWQQQYQLIIKFGAHEYLKQDYPAIYRHLCKHETKLKARGQCKYGRARKSKDGTKPYPGQHHWLELDNNPTDEYLDQFKGEKIMYPNMTKFLPFLFDRNEGFATNDKGFIISTSEGTLGYLTACLNSHLFRCCFRDNFPELMGNTYEVRKILIDKIPIQQPTDTEKRMFNDLVSLVQAAKKAKLDVNILLETLIDACVMECYFRKHMAERDLLFNDAVAEALQDFNADATEAEQIAYLETFHQRLIVAKIPERIARIPEASPDLLGVILKEGKV